MNTYCYPNTDVLINKYEVRNQELLEKIEREYTSFRLIKLEQNPIKGNFDLEHLQKIHHYIFQDIYSWAGKLRTVDIAKANSLFALNQYIKPLCDELFSKLKKENYLNKLNIDKFSDKFSYYAAEINAYHPFREGNGRSTREFLRCLAKENGYQINYAEIGKDKLLNTFVQSFIDTSDLKKLFKSYFIESIKNAYIHELPHIKNANENFLNKLHQANNIISKGKYIPFKQIKERYLILGKQMEDGVIDYNDNTLKSIFDLVIEEKKLKANALSEKNMTKRNMIQDHQIWD